MICFVTALKSKSVSRNWENVSQLYSNSLHSVMNQDDPDFRMITVCHEIPAIRNRLDNRFEFVQVDYAPPKNIVTIETMSDKLKKLTVGMIEAARYHSDFLMLMDADDLVNRRLVSFSKSHPGSNGWVFRRGYRYRHGLPFVQIQDQFDMYCGTSMIVSTHLFEFPRDRQNYHNCILLTNGHHQRRAVFERNNTPLDNLPFIGAMSIVGHSENDSGADLVIPWKSAREFYRAIHASRILTKKIQRDFSLDRINFSNN